MTRKPQRGRSSTDLAFWLVAEPKLAVKFPDIPGAPVITDWRHIGGESFVFVHESDGMCWRYEIPEENLRPGEYLVGPGRTVTVDDQEGYPVRMVFFKLEPVRLP